MLISNRQDKEYARGQAGSTNNQVNEYATKPADPMEPAHPLWKDHPRSVLEEPIPSHS